jgi:FAD:protein FMN transferase
MHSIEFRAMGCQMTAVLDTESGIATDILAFVPEWFAEWEQHLSRFIVDSELNQLNQDHAGDWITVSDVMWKVLQVAHKALCWSDGLVTPLLGEAMQAMGYDRSFELVRDRRARVSGVNPGMFDQTFELDAMNQAVRLPMGARLDLGGIAKGWAAQQAAESLKVFGAALVDAGGDIAMSAHAEGGAWPIGIGNPLFPDEPMLVSIQQGGVATSGKDYRRWRVARDGGAPDSWHHHIIDVRTGCPAVTDVLSATVIAPDVQTAEVAAKVALILGSEAGLNWIEAHDKLAALLVLDNGEMLPSLRLEGYLWC